MRDWASPPVDSRGELVGSVVRKVAVLRARWRVQRRAVVVGRAGPSEVRRAVAMAGALCCCRCCWARGRVKWRIEEEAALLGRCRRARGAESGRLRRAAGVAGTWQPRGGRALPRSERRAGTGAAQRWAGQTRVGLGWRGRGGSLGRLRPWAEKRGGGP